MVCWVRAAAGTETPAAAATSPMVVRFTVRPFLLHRRTSKHRGAHLEDAAAELFVPHLPGADVQMGFEYFVPDPDAAAPQDEPAQYIKRAEGDVLLVVDDVAIIIEAKAVALNPRARAGDSLRLRRDLTRIVTAAAAQAQRLRERIDADHGLLLRDGGWLDLAHVREVHAVAVSLEDLSGVATTTADLVRAGLLAGRRVALDRFPARPAHHRGTHRPSCRTRSVSAAAHGGRDDAEVRGRRRARLLPPLLPPFYDRGVCMWSPTRTGLPPNSPTPVRRASRPDAVAKRSGAGNRADQQDRPARAWYFHQLGHSLTPADKPVMLADSSVVAPIYEITAWGGPGWLSTTVTLLDGSARAQRQYGTSARKLCVMTAQDGRPHSVAITAGTTRLNSHVLIWRSEPDPSLQTSVHSQWRKHLLAKKHQTQAACATGLLVDAASGTLTRVVFDNRVVGPDPQLDRLVAELSLSPTSAGPRCLPPPKAATAATTAPDPSGAPAQAAPPHPATVQGSVEGVFPSIAGLRGGSSRCPWIPAVEAERRLRHRPAAPSAEPAGVRYPWTNAGTASSAFRTGRSPDAAVASETVRCPPSVAVISLAGVTTARFPMSTI
jgi:hypothetical protein